MTPLKIARAFAAAGIPNMPMTRAHILRNVQDNNPADVLASLSSKQLASLIRAANTSYHDGRASNGGAEIIDGDAVWIGAGVEKLVPLAALRAMTVDELYEPREPGATVTWKSTRYQIDYTERC